MIDNSGLHPVTALQSITIKQKQEILKTGIVLCRNLTKEVLSNIGVNKRKINGILKEASDLSAD